MTKQKTDIREVLNEQVPEERDELYNDYVDENTPKLSWFANLCKAFLVGGLICTLGQVLINWYGSMGMDKETAALYNTLTLILLSVLLTGFANSVAAPAIEFKKEGMVFGLGCKIFTIAGPVILYGVVTSWFLGLIYWGGGWLGWW